MGDHRAFKTHPNDWEVFSAATNEGRVVSLIRFPERSWEA
jgi:hypothetical protein